MRILVCGGREFDNWPLLATTLDDYIGAVNCIIEGGAKGADFLARVWAKATGVPYIEFTPDWKKHGKAAGMIRNQQMLDLAKPDLVIAFPGGVGTADMIRRSKENNIEVIIV